MSVNVMHSNSLIRYFLDDGKIDKKITHGIYQLYDNYVKNNVSETSAYESELEMSDFESDELVFAAKPDNKRRSSLAFALTQPNARRKSTAEIAKIMQQFYSNCKED